MANTLQSDQEICSYCDKETAQFFCKTCAGHLCWVCRHEHLKRKISQWHEILTAPLAPLANEEILDVLFCSEHSKEKLEQFCKSCGCPICKMCAESHYLHPLEPLSKDNENSTMCYTIKTKIENNLLPKYKELLQNEDAKMAKITKTADEIEKEINRHTTDVINLVVDIGMKSVNDLHEDKKHAFEEINNFKIRLTERMEYYQIILQYISSNQDERPDTLDFQKRVMINLNRFHTLPTPPAANYSFCSFKHLETMDRNLQENFKKLSRTDGIFEVVILFR